MKTALMINSDVKKNIVNALIRLKEDQLNQLLHEQKERLDNANMEDIDKGDLVESPKEQMMDEIELQVSSLNHLMADIDALKRLNLETIHDRVSYGSLIRANTGYILVGVAFAEMTFEDKKIIGISTHSPLYQKMEGLGAGTEFHLGKIEYVIFEVI